VALISNILATPHSVAFYTLGCKLNYSESSALARQFESQGYAVLPFDEAADIYVINTCSVTESADKKCRNIVRQAQRRSPDARIIVTGCYAQLKPKEIATIPGVDMVLGAAEKFRIIEFAEQMVSSPGKVIVNAGEVSEANSFHSSFSMGDRTRSFLKVQDGCDYKCSFCTIPQARGASRSNTLTQVLADARYIADEGIKEIVLTGVNLGDYGNGTEIIEGNRTTKDHLFIDLIRALDEVEGVERFRISSIEPNLLTDEIIDFVAGSRKFVPHFHIPLQSGSNEVLAQMRRRYKRELYASRVEHIRRVMPHCAIGVDVIVGFPGETDELFDETARFLHDLDVSYLHVFTYSERANTPAAAMSGKVPVHIRRARNEVLSHLSASKRLEFASHYADTVREVLFEKGSSEETIAGYTDNYIRIELPYQADLINTIQQVRIGTADLEGVCSGLLENDFQHVW
jgi:threonylcarbamoyladenosine tRNA methylthiotransferase MtaB